ncbi:MAG: polyribonucleotide nucleotidyltransferase [SAR202 cluster bacterium]|nr:polyribonucleotide nucleotidyltransferase [SAR202 cluster bacterium]
MFDVTTVSREISGKTISIETGKLAGLADAAVTVTCGETVILATAVMNKSPREDVDFLPLTVDYEEKLYAAGKIPGSFFRREGRPTSESILSARLTDRSIRPLFPKNLHNEIQIVLTVMSADQENPPEILAMIGGFACLTISPIPFDGPIAASRIGYKDGEFTINPTFAEMDSNQLNMIVSSTKEAVVMVEAGCDEVSESVILEGFQKAQQANSQIIDMIDELRASVGKEKYEVAPIDPESLKQEEEISGLISEELTKILDKFPTRLSSEQSLDELKAEVINSLSSKYPASELGGAYRNVLKQKIRDRILQEGLRPDGRKVDEIRQISSEVNLLPRVHGSALFTRGQTQVMSIATLGSLTLKQTIDGVSPDDTKRYMHHYNFPGYSTGEARRVGSPGRREIGHGALAERAVMACLPTEEEFPYAIRVVSEVLSSNGSTSMASVCGSSMALMHAGVPMKAPVAGIAMGLISDPKGHAVLSDIQGLEDFLGDMDFKVAGTENGVNALQMDIKIKGLTEEILTQALEQARTGRLFILGKMNEAISGTNEDISPHAPKMIRISVPVDKIGAVIGSRGATIKGIIEETGCTIDINDEGEVTIGSTNGAMIELAKSQIENLTRELEVGDIITGKIARITDFGVFVTLMPGKDGLVRNEELGDIEQDDVEEGKELTILIKEVDRMGRINCSRRALFEGDDQPPVRNSYTPPPRSNNNGPGNRRGNFRDRNNRNSGSRPRNNR